MMYQMSLTFALLALVVTASADLPCKLMNGKGYIGSGKVPDGATATFTAKHGYTCTGLAPTCLDGVLEWPSCARKCSLPKDAGFTTAGRECIRGGVMKGHSYLGIPHGPGALSNSASDSEEECARDCLAKDKCVAFDYEMKGSLMHYWRPVFFHCRFADASMDVSPHIGMRGRYYCRNTRSDNFAAGMVSSGWSATLVAQPGYYCTGTMSATCNNGVLSGAPTCYETQWSRKQKMPHQICGKFTEAYDCGMAAKVFNCEWDEANSRCSGRREH